MNALPRPDWIRARLEYLYRVAELWREGELLAGMEECPAARQVTREEIAREIAAKEEELRCLLQSR